MKSSLHQLILSLILLLPIGPVSGENASLHFVTQEFAPFSYEEGGKAAGPMVEIMQAICAGAKLTCSAEVLPWRRAVADTEDGKADGLFPILATPEREKKFAFLDPVVQTAYSFFVVTDSAWSYKTVQDLSGMTIGVFGPSGTASSLAELLEKNKSAKMEVDISNLMVFKKLAGGRYGPKSAAMMNRDVGRALLQKEKMTGFKLAGNMNTVSYSIGLSRKTLNAAQIEKLNKSLHELKQSGKIKEILLKYQMEEAK